MRIAVVTETSTKEKNLFVVEALQHTGHTVINAGMRNAPGEPELSYIHTGLISAMLLNAGSVDLVVGGCGTGQGYVSAVMQFPGVFCGLLTDPLDAWLFRQINGGNCISVPLNKGFGWGGDVNLRFMFERFFSEESGSGYPPHRKEAQKVGRDLLFDMSARTHKTMPELIATLPDDCILPAIHFPGVAELVKQGPNGAEMAKAMTERLLKG